MLKELAQLVKGRLRPDDILGRYGGEEFCVVLPETDLQGGASIAEELRILVQDHSFVFEQERINVTISLGVAILQETNDVTSFIKAADEHLYAAKRDGRNRVCF